MAEKIRVLIADDVDDTINLIETLLSFDESIEIIGKASNGDEAIDLAFELVPDIILMDINMPGKNGLKTTDIITKKLPEVIVIMMSVQSETEYLKKAMISGAKEYIVKPFNIDTLTNTIHSAYNKEQDRKNYFKKVSSDKNTTKKPRVLSVFSTKGGVGKTTIAINTAISIKRQTEDKVVVMDLDLEFGDASLMFDITPTKTITDLIEDISDLNIDILEEYLMEDSSGVKLLSAPIKPEYADYINPEHIKIIIKVLKEKYKYIIIDTPTNFEEVTLTALDISDKLFFISTMDIPSVKNMKLGLQVMDSLNYSDEKVKILVNNATQKFGIKYKELIETLERDVTKFIPEDKKTVVTSINKGHPFMRKRRNNKIFKGLEELGNMIITGEY
ncbi:MAG: MinD/ParA family protein [Firmicutes bacterium]|nr:MinD/ParA family protein [Bacillota bacterium]